ncbi:hypothetical protein HQ571_05540 [Candidatus Kuenenbacteria bacterium]|nr:hypothetical protein [Candidatus Kuenenbacteria bacterium]
MRRVIELVVICVISITIGLFLYEALLGSFRWSVAFERSYFSAGGLIIFTGLIYRRVRIGNIVIKEVKRKEVGR